MSDINEKCLEIFPTWLKSLGNDLHTFLGILKNQNLGADARRSLTGGINYLFKSLDLIPDGIDDIGYLDDAFILRIAAADAIKDVGEIEDGQLAALQKLADDTKLLEQFLEGALFERLSKYTKGLQKGAARGRTVEEIIENAAVFKEFADETDSFVKEYSTPGFAKDEKNLIKLRNFLEAKLPK